MKTTANTIKIILADDHEILREGIGSIIQKHPHIKIVAEASNGLQLVQLTDEYIPDVILTDIKMPLMDGIEATGIITKKHPHISIIALSMFDDDQFILDMLEAGARGYLLKNADKREIIEAIITMENHGAYFCNNINIKMMKLLTEKRDNKRKQNNKPEFSTKELQVMELICRQFFTKEISETLHLSPRTVEGYRVSILKKINARNSIGIVIYAITNNLYNPSDPGNNPHPKQ